MKLSLMERIQAINLLPDAGRIVFHRIREAMVNKLAPTAEEKVFYGIVEHEGGGITWNPDNDLEAEIDLSDSELALILDNLKPLEADGTLKTAQVSLYEKLI